MYVSDTYMKYLHVYACIFNIYVQIHALAGEYECMYMHVLACILAKPGKPAAILIQIHTNTFKYMLYVLVCISVSISVPDTCTYVFASRGFYT
jgi:hypothetical protein